MVAPDFRTADALGRLANSMVTFLIATILGFLAGLGVGGGNLLMLWMTSAVGMEYSEAKTINLLFFLPAVIITALYRRKQGTLHISKLFPAIVCGCISAAIGCFIGKHIDTTLLTKAFGILLLATGLRELFYRERKAK